MTARTKRIAVAVTGSALLASGAYAVGSQRNDGSAVAADSARSETGRFKVRGPGPFGLDRLAGRLGVSQSKLRSALDGIRNEQQPPDGDPRDRFASDLADALGISKDKVTAALDRLRRRHELDFANNLAKSLGVDAGRVRSVLDRDRPPEPGELAKQLGVSESKLRSALRDAGSGGLPGPGIAIHRFRRGPLAGPPGGPGGPPAPPGVGMRLRFRGPGDGRFAQDLAKELGIDTDKVRSALEKVRAKRESGFRLHRDDFAKKLADKLGLSEDKVKQALPSPPIPPPGGPDH